MWRRREFHWNPFAHQAPAAHPNHDPTSLWRSTHGWNQSGTCRIGWVGWGWGIGLMKNIEKPDPRYSKNFQDDHFYNTRGIWGTFKLVVGPSQPPLDSIISGIKPQTKLGRRFWGKDCCMMASLSFWGISPWMEATLANRITIHQGSISISTHRGTPPNRPTRGSPGPQAVKLASRIFWVNQSTCDGVVNWARLGGLLIWYPAKVWFLDGFSGSGDVVIPQKH